MPRMSETPEPKPEATDLVGDELPFDVVDFSDVPILRPEDFPPEANAPTEADMNADQTEGGRSL